MARYPVNNHKESFEKVADSSNIIVHIFWTEENYVGLFCYVNISTLEINVWKIISGLQDTVKMFDKKNLDLSENGTGCKLLSFFSIVNYQDQKWYCLPGISALTSCESLREIINKCIKIITFKWINFKQVQLSAKDQAVLTNCNNSSVVCSSQGLAE